MSLTRRLLRWFSSTAVLTAALFGLAGRWDLPLFWAYVALGSGSMLAGSLVIDPGLLRERRRPGPGGVDRRRPLCFQLSAGAAIVLAALDAGRFHWSAPVPLGLSLAALLGLALSFAGLVWAVANNPFFSPVVRIQAERGHVVVRSGPYGLVRHPGYLASVAAAPCGALALGSWWALVPAAAFVILMLRRTAIEDRFLHQELPGYREYAAAVRFRLVPGVW
jgi:protein-S-isoprenylcysteine O-methyltransferase Ste14